MGDFVVDPSLPLVSQRGNVLRELEWGDFVCLFSKSHEDRIRADCCHVYWRCPDRTCPGGVVASVLENGVESEFSQTKYHRGQALVDGQPSCDVSLRCKGVLTRDEVLIRKFKAQGRQYALATDTVNGVLNGQRPQAVVHQLRAAALQHPTLCGDIWLPKVYTTRQIADIRAHVNKKSGNQLVAPQTNVDIWNNLPLDHPYRYFQCARSELQGQELFFQGLHDFQSPVVVNGVSQPCGGRGGRGGRGGCASTGCATLSGPNEAMQLTNQGDPLSTHPISFDEISEASLEEEEQQPPGWNKRPVEQGIDPIQAILFAVSDADKERVYQAWSDTSMDLILDSNQSAAKTVVTRRSFRSLMAKKWVDDEIINTYISGFLKERDDFLCKKECHRKPSIFFSSFLFSLLFNENVYDFSAVRKWTVRRRRALGGPINLRDYDKVFIPINSDNSHWILIVLCMETKEVLYLDSLYKRANEEKFVGIAFKWLADNFGQNEEQFKREWQLLQRRGGPQQRNGYDCGIFVILNASFLADDLPLNFPTDSKSMLEQRYRLAINMLDKRVQF